MSRTSSTNHHHSLNLNVRGLKTSATLAINEKCRKLRAEGREVYFLGLGQSPFPVPEIVAESLRQHAHEKDYLPVRGLRALQEAVASFNQRTQKLTTHPENVLIGPGSKELIFILQLVYYGDLIIPTPSWVSYAPQARIIGRQVHWIPTREDNFWRLSAEQLEELCVDDPDRPRIVILNYPSNPTGYTYPLERLKKLAEVARKYHVILVSDEIYGLLHHQAQHVSIARFYPEGTIISNGLSKWCGAGGWRLGTFSFPSSLTWLQDALAVVASETFTSTSAPIQHAAITGFGQHEEIEEYLRRNRWVLKTIARSLQQRLERMGLNVPTPHGGFYMFPNFEPYRERLEARGIHTSTQLCAALLEDTGVAMLPGADFGRRPEEYTVRIAYVDFDGKHALENTPERQQNNNSNQLQEQWVRANAPRLVEAFERMGHWLAGL